jgi:hypothetical protein
MKKFVLIVAFVISIGPGLAASVSFADEIEIKDAAMKKQICQKWFDAIGALDRYIAHVDSIAHCLEPPCPPPKALVQACKARDALADVYNNTGCTTGMLGSRPTACADLDP